MTYLHMISDRNAFQILVFFLSFLSSFFFVFILQASVLIIESWGVGLMNTMKEGKNRISRGDQVSRRTTLSWLGIRV